MAAPETPQPENAGPRATRRSLLTGTAAGLATLAGSTTAGLLRPVPAAAATTGTDWIVLTPSNDPGGATDTANINNALKSCVPGQVVYLSNGAYRTNAPILVPEGVGLRGPIGATQSASPCSSCLRAAAQIRSRRRQCDRCLSRPGHLHRDCPG